MIISSITSLILINWLAMLYFTCYPTSLIIEYTRKDVVDNYGIDPNRKAFFGLSMMFISTAEYILLVETFFFILVLGTVVAFCAWSIDHCLRVNAMSLQTKKLHRQMLIMLILQPNKERSVYNPIKSIPIAECVPGDTAQRTSLFDVPASVHRCQKSSSDELHY
ncbi:hypothetical protein OSTOST_07923, partial [Ostertagia ostertagi]